MMSLRSGLILVTAALLLSLHEAAAKITFTHIVIIVQENRSTDNLFGSNPTFEPGVDIATYGINSKGAHIHLTAEPLASCYDIPHTHQAFVNMYAQGAMNGADLNSPSSRAGCKVPASPQFKFADNSTGDLQPYFDLAEQYGFANRMFQTNQGPSFPAHQFLFGGTSAPTTNSRLFVAENTPMAINTGCIADPTTLVAVIGPGGNENAYSPVHPCFNRPTMADLLTAAHLTWHYYNNTGDGSIWNAPVAIRDMCVSKTQHGQRVCTGAQYTANVTSNNNGGTPAQVLTDIANCKMPNVAWVIPSAAASDHAGINDGTGPNWVASIVNAIGTQPACANGEVFWKDTAIVITWDDWGGWYDHAVPYHIGGWSNHDWGQGYIYGFRVPMLVVSAYTRPGFVDNTNYDFGSILAFAEQNFALGKIGPGYYADAEGTQGLKNFFPLADPRDFHLINTKHDAKYFLTRPASNVGPDDD